MNSGTPYDYEEYVRVALKTNPVVSACYPVNAGELEIKMAQGNKPGEGGQLPGTR